MSVLKIKDSNNNWTNVPSIKGDKGDKGDTGSTGATGVGVGSVSKTGTSGNVDTYTVYSNQSTPSALGTFTVTNSNVSSVAGKTGAVTLDADDVTYDPTDTYSSGTVGKTISAINNSISPYVTASMTAPVALSVGDYILVNSTLYRVIKPIANGATLTLNTNVVATTEADELKSKAVPNGNYPDMTVGNAEQLVATVGVEDKVPYLFRTSGGSADIGNREVDELVGGTVAWNQLVQNGNFASTSNVFAVRGTVSAANNILTYTITELGGGGAQNRIEHSVALKTNHVTYAAYDFNPTKATKMQVLFSKTGGSYQSFASGLGVEANKWTQFGFIVKANDDWTSIRIGFSAGGDSDTFAVNDTVGYRNVMVFDLTQMFGSTIADYIYALEQANAGAGVAWFRKLFPKPYYAYNAGELMSVKTSAHKMVGFNAWDEEWEGGRLGYDKDAASWGQNVVSESAIRSKNYIPVLPGTSYYGKFASGATAYAIFYDADKNPVLYGSAGYGAIANQTFTIPSTAHFIRFYVQNTTTYNHDICINLSWSGYRNGEYEPYESHTYALDNIDLRGIPKLDADNKLYYAGDTYESDGTVTRKYGIVTFDGSSDEGWHGYTNNNELFIAYVDLHTLAKVNNYVGSIIPSGKFNVTAIHGTAVSSVFNISGYNDINNSYPNQNWLYFSLPETITSVNEAKAWFASNPVTVVYELATPTTESANPYPSQQIVNDFGTEEYIDSRDVPIPVGHVTQYQENLRDKLQHLPDLASDNGDYIIRQTDEQMSLEAFPYVKSVSGKTGVVTLDASDVGAATPEDVYKAFPTDNASGAVASFPDGAAVPVKSLVANIDPVQDLHGYDAPWPAGGGANKLPPVTISRTAYSPTISTSGDEYTINGESEEYGQAISSDYVTLPAGDYYFKVFTISGTGSVNPQLRSSDGTIVYASASSGQFTLTESTNIYPRITWNAGTFTNLKIKMMVVTGSTAPSAFSPYSNICPITGHSEAKVTRTGKNLLSPGLTAVATGSATATPTQNGGYIIKATASAPWLWVRFNALDATAFAGKRIVFSFNVSVDNTQNPNTLFTIRDSAGTALATKTITYSPGRSSAYIDVPADVAPGSVLSMTLYVTASVTATAGWETTYSDLQMEIVSSSETSPSAYEPYTGTTIPITIPTPPGTVYGGTLDVLTGVLTVDRAYITVNAIAQLTSTNNASYKRAQIAVSPTVKYGDVAVVNQKLICDRYKTRSANGTYTRNDGISDNNASNSVVIYDGSLQTTEAWNASIENDPLHIVYPLATPQTVQLDPETLSTILGENNVWADTGDVSVTYRADPSLYVDKKISAAEQVMELIVTANREDSMKATKAYASGDLIITGGKLYKATTSIANGATLTVNTNISQTTVAAEIAAVS